MTPWTSTSGAEAPAVTPTVRAPSSQAKSRPEASSIRWASAPDLKPTSANLTEFEELALPSTSNTWARAAMVFTAA